NNENRSSAYFIKAVDTGEVSGWTLPNPVLCFLNKVIALPELSGSSRTNLGTCRLLAGNYAIRAHNALAYPRIQRLPFVLRLGKRTRHHAIPAANAFPDVVHDWTLFGFMESAHWTNRRASRMLAVHAQPPHELVVFGQNHRVFMCRLHRLGGYLVVIRQFVLLRACTFTLLAPDAHGRVIEQSLAHRNYSSLFSSGTSVPEE